MSARDRRLALVAGLLVGIATTVAATTAWMFPQPLRAGDEPVWRRVLIGYIIGLPLLAGFIWVGVASLRRAWRARRGIAEPERSRIATLWRDSLAGPLPPPEPPVAPPSLLRAPHAEAPKPWSVAQETLHLLAPIDAWVLSWADQNHHRSTYVISAAFPEVPSADWEWLRGRISELDALAGRWCATEWGRDGGEPSNEFVDRMAVSFPECSRWAIGEVLDWNMFISR